MATRTDLFFGKITLIFAGVSGPVKTSSLPDYPACAGFSDTVFSIKRSDNLFFEIFRSMVVSNYVSKDDNRDKFYDMSWRVLNCRRAIFSLRTINFPVDQPVVLLRKNPGIEEKTTAPCENMVKLTRISGKNPKTGAKESPLKRLFLPGNRRKMDHGHGKEEGWPQRTVRR